VVVCDFLAARVLDPNILYLISESYILRIFGGHDFCSHMCFASVTRFSCVRLLAPSRYAPIPSIYTFMINDRLTVDPVNAIFEHKFGSKCAMITPDEGSLEEFKLKEIMKSLNGTVSVASHKLSLPTSQPIA